MRISKSSKVKLPFNKDICIYVFFYLPSKVKLPLYKRYIYALLDLSSKAQLPQYKKYGYAVFNLVW